VLEIRKDWALQTAPKPCLVFCNEQVKRKTNHNYSGQALKSSKRLRIPEFLNNIHEGDNERSARPPLPPPLPPGDTKVLISVGYSVVSGL